MNTPMGTTRRLRSVSLSRFRGAVIERQGDQVDHKLWRMASASADNGATRGQSALLVRVVVVADAIYELQCRCIHGFVLFRSLCSRLRLVVDGLLSRGLLDARAERTLVDLTEFVGLIHLAASGKAVRTYDVQHYWMTRDRSAMGIGKTSYVGLARGALTSVDDLADAIVLHPLRVRFTQEMTARAFQMLGWLDESSSSSVDWVDSEQFVRDHREQLAELVMELQARPREEIRQAVADRYHGWRIGFQTARITNELAQLVFVSHSQLAGETDLEMEWADLPKGDDPVAKFLPQYYESDFALHMRGELGGWRLYPRFSVMDQATLAPVQAEPRPALSCAIPSHELYIVAPLGCRSISFYEGKWLNSDVTIQTVSADPSSESFWVAAEQWFSLNHPNVMKLCGASELEDKRLFVWEPTVGETLTEFLSPIRDGPKPVAVRWRRMLDVALALRYLHNSGIVHGNIRSSSIWLGRDFATKLNCSNLHDPTRRQLRRPLASPRWGAPESLVNDYPEFSTKSDVFTLAKLIAQTRIPVQEYFNYGVRYEHQDHVLREQTISGELRDLSPAFSAEQATLLFRMCCVDPHGRPTMAEVEEEVRSARFDEKTCELVATMRSAHDRNVFYGPLPTLSTIVRPDSRWDSPSSELEASKSFSVGLAVLDGIAPELAMGGRPSFASDVFSLGILTSTMISDQPWRELYQCPAPPCVIGSWMRNNVLPARPSAFTEAEWDLVKRMCAFDPSARVSISTVVDELSSIVGNRAEIREDATIQWNPAHFEVSSYGISVANALAVANELLPDQENTEDPRTSGARWILRRLQDIDRVLSMDAPPRHVPLLIAYILGDTTGSLVTLLMNEDTDSSSSSQNFWSNSVISTSGGVHAMHRDIDHILNELCLSKSALNTRLHEWRQQWELEQHSQVRRIASSVSCDQSSLEEPTPEWFWPPYTITRSLGLLGSGGFGQVHEGRWLGTPVVVKRVEIFNELDRVRFRHEVDLWFRLSHPHVIQLFGACHVGADPFFVCEHATNGQLDKYLQRNEAKCAQTSWKLLLDAALGLLYLHSKGIVHADLKCDNILVSDDNKGKLADFGLSLDVESQSTHNCNQENLGAVQWRAPEVLRGEKPSFESDMFSFGMCIYQAVSGQRPWGPTPPERVKEHVQEKQLPRRRSEFMDGQWKLIQRMCCFEPSERLRITEVVPILRQIVEWNSLLDAMFVS